MFFTPCQSGNCSKQVKGKNQGHRDLTKCNGRFVNPRKASHNGQSFCLSEEQSSNHQQQLHQRVELNEARVSVFEITLTMTPL